MRKLIFLILLINSLLITKGQDINFIPSTPQSFQFTKDKTVAEDEHTGKLNIDIPLLNYRGNKLSTSVSLDYFGAGVKVDDLPNDTGMTWLINVGGIITRTVNAIPDETDERLNKTYDEIISTTGSDCDADDIIRKICYQPTVIDSEKDVFNIKVHNISASFYFDENFNPYFMKNESNVKIKTINSNPALGNRSFVGFEVTDIQGVKYIFGGSNDYREMTASKMMPNPGGIGISAYTSYFLKEIIHPNHEKIFFSYQNTDWEIYEVYENNVCYLYVGTGLPEEPNAPSHLPNDVRKSTQNLHTLGKKRIDQISSSENSQIIKFNYIIKSDSEFKTYLSSIELKENNIQKEKISFSYIFDGIQNNNVAQRFFLTSAQYSKNGTLEKQYKFSYNDPLALPKRLAYSQDMSGFFNNKNSNQSLIPLFYNPPAPLSAVYTPAILGRFGDRTPDFSYASKGVLTEITYPSGGKTVIDYESNPMRDLQEHNLALNLLYNNNVMNPDIFYAEHIIENLYQPQEVIFTAQMGSDNFNGNHTKGFTWQLIDIDTNTILFNSNKYLGYSSQSQVKTYMLFPGKRYKLIAKSIQSDPTPIVSIDSYVIANVHFSYKELSPTPIDGFGIRIKSVKEIDGNDIKNYKRFYYRPTELYNQPDTKFLRIAPQISYITTGSSYASQPVSHYAMNSSANTSEIYNSKSQDRYEFVTTSLGGDNFENGGSEKKFIKDFEEPNQKLHTDPGYGAMISSSSTGMAIHPYVMNAILSTTFSNKSNRMMFSGNLLRTRNFVKKGTNILKSKQTNYFYNYIFVKSEPNLIVYKIYDDNVAAYCNNVAVQRIAQFYIGLYNHYTINNKLFKEETVNYIDYMPLDTAMPDPFFNDDYLNPNYRKQITTANYEHGNSNHNQITFSKTKFQDNSVNETTYAYAHEKNNQYLISKNIIGIPLETTVIKKKDSLDVGKVLSKSEIVYPVSQTEADTKTSGLALPYQIKSTDYLGINSTEVTYDKYDLKGNLQQYTTKDGIPVAIIWGYNNTQPIAKIEGATYGQVSSLAAAIVTASDTDALAPPNNDEAGFLAQLDAFRKSPALLNYQISTYTYDPLIGVRSITPPSGIREVYFYDSANRLENIKDVNGKVLKEFKYNYKP